MINLFQPSIGEEALLELKNVFDSNWLGRGNKSSQFEQLLAKYLGVSKDNLGTNACCTDSIFSSIKLLELDPDDLVTIPTNSFPAVGSAVLEAGAKLAIVDIKQDGNIDLEKIPKDILKETKVFFITHYGGIPVDINSLRQISSKEVLIFEDCACALGSFQNGISVGSNADFACWSFDPMKLVSTGEGGAYFSKNMDFVEKLKIYNYLGLPINEKSGLDKSADSGNWWTYDVCMPGRRSMFCDFHAAIGIPEIEKVNNYLERKNNIRDFYEKSFNKSGIDFVKQDDPSISYSNYFMTIKHPKRNDLASYMKQNNVYTSLRYSPLHKMSIFKDYAYGDFKGSEIFYNSSLNIPIHQNLKDEDVDKICKIIENFDK